MGGMCLQVLEMCMNHCGEKFHSEVAKFRFLNELIKVLSPKVSIWTWPCPLGGTYPQPLNSCCP